MTPSCKSPYLVIYKRLLILEKCALYVRVAFSILGLQYFYFIQTDCHTG